MRVQAPFGRRRVAVTGADDVGAYRVLHAADLDGPLPWPGQFYMLAAVERWGAGEDERPFVPRAFSFLGAADGQLSFMFEDVGPGTRRLGELRAGDELWITGPLGEGFELPAAAAARSSPAAASASRRSRRGRAPCARGAPPAIVLGFRDGAHAAGAKVFEAAARARRRAATAAREAARGGRERRCGEAARTPSRSPPTTARSATTASSPSCSPPSSTPTTTPSSTPAGRPRMLEAVRALCDARDVPAQLALEAGMACGFGACFGCVVPVRDGGYVRVCVDGPVLDASRLEAVPAH